MVKFTFAEFHAVELILICMPGTLNGAVVGAPAATMDSAMGKLTVLLAPIAVPVTRLVPADVLPTLMVPAALAVRLVPTTDTRYVFWGRFPATKFVVPVATPVLNAMT